MTQLAGSPAITSARMPPRVRLIGGPPLTPTSEAVAEVGDPSEQQPFLEAERLVAPLRERQATGMAGVPALTSPKPRYPPSHPGS